jgi:hypothetical protein
MIKISNSLMTKENAHLYLPLIQALAEGKTIEYGSGSIWGQVNEPKFIYPPQYYRIKPEPVMVPLGPEDVPPGSVIRMDHWADHTWKLVSSIDENQINFGQNSWSTYEALQKCFEIKRPGEDWKPCHKPA